MNKEKLWQRSKQRIRFRNDDMDFYFAWILAHQNEGGSALGECFYTASQIKDGDPESWYKAWSEMARRVESQATQALANGHRVSAREAYLRAFTYHQMAAIFVRPQDQRLREGWQKAQWCFRQAAAQCKPPIEPIQIPFAGKVLPGYFLCGHNENRKAPTLILIGGGETCAEELYFWIGPAGVRRRYHVLLIDLPGQGSTPFDGLFFRVDSELPIKAVVIYQLVMAEIPSVLLKTPGFFRNTLTRLAGLRNPLPGIALEKFCWQAGVSTISEALEMARQARVERIEEITCPVLCMVGEGESEAQMMQAREFYNALRCPKAFRVFVAADGADAHCQINNLGLMQQVVFDWLDEVFGYRAENL
jgi:hypothetical protein